MIRIQNLVKKYGEIAAVNDISLDVPAGEIFAFLGPNGAGKTTTIKMLTTLLTPTSGTIRDRRSRSRRRSRPRCAGASASCSRIRASTSELTAYENMDLHGVLYGVPAQRRATSAPSSC